MSDWWTIWRSSRVGICVAVAGMAWMLAVVGIGGCDRDTGKSAKSVEASTESKTQETSKWGDRDKGRDDQGAAADLSLPGDKPPGTLEPRRLGPRGPAVMFLSGLKGYLEPCGCTADVLLGGIERIVGYVGAAKPLYSGALMVDGGDLLFSEPSLDDHQVEPEKSSIDVLVEAYQAMEVKWTVPGELDFALGPEFYGETLARMGVTPLVANAEIESVETKESVVRQVGKWSVGIVGSIDPALFEDVPAVRADSSMSAVQEAVSSVRQTSDAVVVLHHGGLADAKSMMREVEGIDFVVVGHGPREKSSPDLVEGAYTLEAYDQGRYVGVMSLHNRNQQRPFRSARVGGGQSVESIEKQIAHVRESLDKLPPADAPDAPALVGRLEERLASLEKEKQEAQTGGIEMPNEHRAFVYRSVGMRPGYPVAESIQAARAKHNRRLKKLVMEIEREVPAVAEGEATYIGTNQCATCHGDAHSFWEGTDHAKAVQTLKERNKAFDQKCIGCHVVGYEKPGGSVLGKLSYEEKVDGRTITKDLKDVGCETCHGPGSNHWMAPVGPEGTPQNIIRDPGREQCMSCHVPEHSPKFDFESYVRRVTGEGHEQSSN